jgi:toxin-antitoxin system PIN domain toxin
VTLLDANILIYAYNADAPEHPPMREWLSDLFSQRGQIGIPWLVLWAFIRVATNPRLSPAAKPAAEAFRIVRTLLAQSRVMVVEPGPRHSEILEQLIAEYRISGPFFTDAALAALAIEHGATLASTDRDFSRFPNLRWINPLSAS